MCGIFGYVDWAKRASFDIEKLKVAANLLYHRGPDGGAYYFEAPFFLAHRRLSIIELSLLGVQPMFSPEGRYSITFNGEIYNFVELKEELSRAGYSFKTHSDTEVILAGYHHWGRDVCQKLIGMFAFAIADLKENTLFLARDRMGEKPLFYFYHQGVFSFASELKSLTYCAPFPLETNQEAFSEYLCLNYTPGDHTLLQNIHKLKPGGWIFVSENGLEEGQYWTPSVKDSPHTLEQAVEQLEILLEESVKIGSRSDVPITLALSGGIDSSLVGYYAAVQGSLKEAYCVDFEEKGFSEWGQAKIVADRLGLHLEKVPFSSKMLESYLDIVYHADDPLADSSALPVWALSEAVSKKYKVMLGGDGGDESFGGYLTYKATLLYSKIYDIFPDVMRNSLKALTPLIPPSGGKVSTNFKLMRFLRAFDLPPQEAHLTWNGTWHPRDVGHLLRGQKSDSLKNLNSCHFPGDALQKLQQLDLENYLPSDILTKVDRMTMAYGLEARAPFLHPDIVDFGLSLPAHLKMPKGGKPKHILRVLAEKKFGREIANAKKQGFSIPINQWLRHEAKDILLSCLNRETLREVPFLNADFILRELQAHLNGKKEIGFELWGLMVFITWHQQKILRPYYPVQSQELRSLQNVKVA